MPFKSISQYHKFYELKKKGKLSFATIKKWLEETPNFTKLPYRKK